MNNKIRKFLLFMILALASLPACQNWIDPDINVNPNEPADVTMEALLPFIEADVAFKIGGSFEIIGFQSIWLQQLDGVDRQALGVSNYTFDPLDITQIWDDSYAEILMDTRVLTTKAAEAGSPHNAGVAGILTALTLGQLTDSWGSIPWSEALMGDEIIQPVYDTQEYVYNEIQIILDRAIDSLSIETDESGINGDYYYNGDPVKWIRAAHALKARYYLHLSKRMGTEAYEKALEEIPLSFFGNEDDMQFNYGTGETESNPLYQFMQERDNARMGDYFIEMLKANNDPRLIVFATLDDTGGYSGSLPGQANIAASKPGPAFAAPDAPTYIITYVEVLFTRAEAMLQTGQAESDAKNELLLAVSMSLEKFNVTDTAWLNEYSQGLSGLSGEALFEEIMKQKYIATFYQPEAFQSWRRTGYPVIPPNPAGATDEIPRRFLYPTSELVYNQNMPKGITITDRVWWDE